MRITSVLVLAVLGLGGIMCLPGVTNATTTLSDNLSTTAGAYLGAYTQVGGTQWVTSSFGTDNTSYVLDSVTLYMYRNGSVTAEVDIYTDSSTAPGSLVGVLTSPASYPSIDSPGQVTFTTSGITLNPNSTYWVVLKAQGDQGALDWAYSFDISGSGVGFQQTMGYSNSLGTWTIDTTNPMMMKVEATTVPLPPTMLLLGSGLLGLVGWRRFRKS
jgi:hypothetical protein